MIGKLRSAAFLALFVVALISVVQGFLNAINHSQDFQWSPALLFAQGENPYQVWLEGNKEGAIILSQAPNYLHQLYLFFTSLGVLSFEHAKPVWAALNIVIGFGICLGIAAYFRLSRPKTYFLLLVFLCSTPFRNGIGNGQHALFVFAFLMLPFLQMRGSLVLQGIGFSKYSFAPPFFTYNVFRVGPLKAALGLLLPILGWLVFSLWTSTSPITTLTQPLQVASVAVGTGTGDLMSLMEAFLDVNTFISGATAFLCAVVLSFFASRHPDHNRHLPLVCLISLVTFTHLGYDFVFLLPVLAYSLALRNWQIYVPIWIGVIWFWFGLKVVNFVINFFGLEIIRLSDFLIALNFTVLAAMIALLLKRRPWGKENSSDGVWKDQKGQS